MRDGFKAVCAWPPEAPDPSALRCEFSRHRTLAHFRACQEQWLIVVQAFAERSNPNVTILHPWRKFTSEGYELIPWEDHLSKFAKDRKTWLEFLEAADWPRGGTMNRRPETIASMAGRLASHEAYHIEALLARESRSRLPKR